MALGKDISLGLRKDRREGEGSAIHLQNSSLSALDTAPFASLSPAPFRQQDLPWKCTCVQLCT